MSKLLRFAEVTFLLGIAILIVRNNSYPWPIKRASDILFLLSALAALIAFFLDRERSRFLQKIRKPLVGLALIFGGIGIATVTVYFINGIALNTGGILSIARFAEVAITLILAAYFGHHNQNFYKLAALAQLSTLVYLPVLIAPDTLYPDPAARERFRLFENWPSNVGYYLIVSLSFFFVHLLKNIYPFRTRFFIHYLAGIGLSGILVWTGSRGSWLGVTIATIMLFLLSYYTASVPTKLRVKKILMAGLIVISLPVLSFPLLPDYAQSRTIIRFLPPEHASITGRSVSGEMSSRAEQVEPSPTTASPDLAEKASDKNIIETYTSDRFSLWSTYSKRILKSPLGLGPNYEPERADDNAKGPHNTLLEILVIAGPLGLLGFIYLFFLAFQNLLSVLKSKIEWHWAAYIIAALSGLAIATFFDNMSTFRLLWLVLALGIFFKPRELITS